MTLKEAIVKFDTEKSNNIPDELKIGWLSSLDSSVFHTLVLTHDNPNNISFSPYNVDTPEDTVLLIPEPFCDIYFHYLAIKSDLYYSDINKYNVDLTLYSSLYLEFERYYNRNYMPKKVTPCFNV
ncbi:MAG: hypothetical protein IKU48_01315 [Clostridia bacterium]|nr:hypothetical protein [Clostridia bacterium]